MTDLPAIPQIDTPGELRLSLRETAWPRPTFGAAPGFLQCNLLILPHGLAHDFSAFCAANAQACPLIYQTSPGQWDMPELGDDIDLRTDLGSYRVFRDGQAVADLLDLDGAWQGDFVAFVLGSSFGLEAVFAAAGIETPYLTRGEAPAHYIAGRDSRSSGTFRGPSAVTMRSLTAADAARVEALCEAYPHLHGAPLAIGDTQTLGIESLAAPVAEIGRWATVREGEVPVFWASALTAQLALSAARLPFCIANTPGHLLVTDLEVEALRRDAEGDATDAGIEAAAPVEIATRAAVTDTAADDHGYASAIRPARGAVAGGGRKETGANADAGPDAEAEAEAADDDTLRTIDEEEAAAIAADAAGGDSPAKAHGYDMDEAEVPPFADDPVPAANEDPGDDDAADQDVAAGADDAETDGDPLLDRVVGEEAPAEAATDPLMEWRRPPLSAGKLIRQRLAAASTPNAGKRESIFW